MKRFYIVMAILVALATLCVVSMALLLPGSANAQGVAMIMQIPCNETKTPLKLLTEKYHEEAVAGGISGAGDQVRLFVSDANTFSVVVTKPGGLSCLYQGGGDWTDNPAKIKGDDL